MHWLNSANGFCKSIEEANVFLAECTSFLETRLKLKLNPAVISEIKNGVEFLGLMINNRNVTLSSEKKAKLATKIRTLKWEDRKFDTKGLDELKGIQNYYAPLLPQEFLVELDDVLISQLRLIVKGQKMEIPNKTALFAALKEVPFFSEDNTLRKAQIKSDLVNDYLLACSEEVKQRNEQKNKRLISRKKHEYRQKENEASELVVSTFGAFIGINNKGVIVKISGKKHALPTSANL